MASIAARFYGLLSLGAVALTGCASLGWGGASRAQAQSLLSTSSGGTASASSATAVNDPSQVRRASYIEERYRDIPNVEPKKEKKFLEGLNNADLKRKWKEATGKGRDPKVAKQLLGEAEALYEQARSLEGDARAAKLIEAAEKYEAAAERWPNSALEEDALYMAGDAYFYAQRFPSANTNYELLVKQYPNTRHMDRVDANRFVIAQKWLEREKERPESFYEFNFFDKTKPTYDTDGHALRIYDRIRIDDPTGKLADDATLAAANAHFAAGRFMQADDLYTDLRKAFPNSEHQFTAHFAGLKAKLNSYQGPDYSGQALDESEKLIKQIRKQFPRQAEEQKEYLTRALAEVRYKKAERLWTMGHFHELRLEYGAAKVYFDEILADFGETPFAEKAKQQIAANAGKPDVPPQRAQWLVDAFPKRQPAKPLWKTDDPVNAKKR